MIETRDYAKGTSVTSSYPWGFFVRARLLCADGKVRATRRLSQTADTFFSVPCAIKANGKTVAGYMTFRDEEDGRVAVFCAYLYRKNHGAL